MTPAIDDIRSITFLLHCIMLFYYYFFKNTVNLKYHVNNGEAQEK